MKTIRRWRRALVRRAAEHGESGQALAEIAIALPLLLLMLIGIWEFARAYQIQQVVVNAAREGARTVVLPDSTVAAATAVTERFLEGGSVPCEGCVTITNTTDGSTPEGKSGHAMNVTVEVPYEFNWLGPMIRLATGHDGGPGDIMLRSSATMRHE